MIARHKIALLIFVTASALMCPDARGQRPTHSLIQLIANPEKFHGATVRIHGVVSFRDGNVGVYIAKEHHSHRVTTMGVWLEISKERIEELKLLDGRFCIIEGEFDSKDTGNYGAWPGTISKITMLHLHEFNPKLQVDKVEESPLDENQKEERN
jgi:hypothetical protein